jgi:hypothetical protein
MDRVTKDFSNFAQLNMLANVFFVVESTPCKFVIEFTL